MNEITLSPNCNHLERKREESIELAEEEACIVLGRVKYSLSAGQVYFIEKPKKAPYGKHECHCCNSEEATIPMSERKDAFLCVGCARILRQTTRAEQLIPETIYRMFDESHPNEYVEILDLRFIPGAEDIKFEIVLNVRADEERLRQILKPIFLRDVELEVKITTKCICCSEPLRENTEVHDTDHGPVCLPCLENDMSEPLFCIFWRGDDDWETIGEYHNFADSFEVDEKGWLRSEEYVEVEAPYGRWDKCPHDRLQPFGEIVGELFRDIDFALVTGRRGHPTYGSDYEIWVEIGKREEAEEILKKLEVVFEDPGKWIPGIEPEFEEYVDDIEIGQDILEACMAMPPQDYGIVFGGETIQHNFSSEKEAEEWLKENIRIELLSEGWPDEQQELPEKDASEENINDDNNNEDGDSDVSLQGLQKDE